MEIENVLVAGAGTLGSEIAFRCAFHGFRTTVLDIDAGALDRCRRRHDRLATAYANDLGAAPGALEAAAGRLTYTTDLEAAAATADLVSESVPEDPDLKRRVLGRIGRTAPPHAILTTNSSTLLPGELSEATGRPERFLALHFANRIHVHNIAEIMPHPGTDPAVTAAVEGFARAIGMVPVQVRKQRHGYVLNTLLTPLLSAAIGLAADGTASPEDIDRTWMIATGCPQGPCATLDSIGLDTAWRIASYWAQRTGDRRSAANAAYLEERFLDRGHLGVKTGHGFYTYPGPAWQRPGFLDPGTSGEDAQPNGSSEADR